MNTTSSAPLLAYLVSLDAAAQDAPEHSILGLVQRQITAIELLADHAKRNSFDTAGARYRFDYSRFATDLKRMSQGIHKCLSPSRAQPADLIELTGDYLAEAPLARPSDEHD